ncbi:hypothetical protein M758_7G091300 [Ceratodon purpureus]|nr:hypothetical protein M758_7G091300 [Ceratodon purpureus]
MAMLLAPSTFGFLTKPLHDAGFMATRASVSAQIGVRGLCVKNPTGLQWRCCASAVSGGGHIEVDSKASASVVVTREHGKNGKLMKALEKRGVQCLELPLIEHRDGPDLPRLVQTLREVEFEWIIITSPEAASVFLGAWKEADCPKVRISVVGAGTGELFKDAEESNLLEVAFTPSKATAKVLASELPKLSDGNNHILYPSSVKAGADLETGLKERGFHVLRMNTYSTETVRNLDDAAIAAAASVPVATFASPTAVKAWMELVAGPRNWDGAAACIGSTSANAASRAGLQKIYHPESPGIEGYVLTFHSCVICVC